MESLLLTLLIFILTGNCLPSSVSETANVTSYHECATKCGDIEFSYPFGIGDDCYLPGFGLTCKEGALYIPSSSTPIQILDILQGEVRINTSSYMVWYCLAEMNSLQNVVKISLDEDGPYTFSAHGINMVVIGCDAEGTITDGVKHGGHTCFSRCFEGNNTLDASCSEDNCCKVSIPKIWKTLNIILSAYSSAARNSSTCAYAFLAEDGRFKLKQSNTSSHVHITDISMKFEWAIGKQKCKQAMYSADYACGENAACIDADRGSGYLCKCMAGFEGNPYLNGAQGCQDIDECSNSTFNICVPEARCQNRVPSYACHCPPGSLGNGLRGHGGCSKRLQVILAAIGSALFAGFLALCFARSYLARKRRKLKARYFQRNGGLLLKQWLNGDGSGEMRLFSSTEVKKATKNYSKKRVLGSGSQGTVYKGVLQDGSIIAIKKSQEVAESHVDQFINELVVLSQVSHRSIVRLLGCCLETEVPLLVYEFIPSGTLQQKLLRVAQKLERTSWNDRIQIAIEVAEALSYLHSHASTPIIHRDIKPSNILLDQNCNPKLADFGISRLVSPDKHRAMTAVKGTVGYLDPEYFRSGRLTEKIDVYSFGVVLLELLTCLQPDKYEDNCNYSGILMNFFSYVQEGNMQNVFDEGIISEAHQEKLKAVLEIAQCCLSMKGEERPSMQRVVELLASLKDESQIHTIFET